jgi:topoisomerase-4 subunit A
MVDVMGWKAIGTKLVDFSKTVEMAWENKVVIKDPNDTQPELF